MTAAVFVAAPPGVSAHPPLLPVPDMDDSFHLSVAFR